jgi:L-seryl-tRNA(Ser) seleniumtransferase
LIDDVGHGCLSDFSQFGLPRERTLREAVSDGADIVLASCDKLMGGPQAGVILGKKDLVREIGRHPLARAVRVDKLTLAALVPVLEAYAEGNEASLPIWKYATRPLAQVKQDAQRLARAFRGAAVVEQGFTEMGGGSMPGAGIPTWRAGLSAGSAEELLGRLRNQAMPIIGRIEKGRVWLDPRTCEPDDVKYTVKILNGMAESA